MDEIFWLTGTFAAAHVFRFLGHLISLLLALIFIICLITLRGGLCFTYVRPEVTLLDQLGINHSFFFFSRLANPFLTLLLPILAVPRLAYITVK
jgi:hypothetical protein